MKNNNELYEELLQMLDNIEYISPEEIPSIDLYMDQVTTFMDRHLKFGKRNEKDKLLTKTMINNYAKNDLLPPPVKKKYSRDHMIFLLYIYYLKGFLSISDIQTLLAPMSEKYFGDEEDSVQKIYKGIFKTAVDKQMSHLKDEIHDEFEQSFSSFKDYPADDRQYLQIMSFISSLSFDIYLKKRMIETIIDEMKQDETKTDK